MLEEVEGDFFVFKGNALMMQRHSWMISNFCARGRNSRFLIFQQLSNLGKIVCLERLENDCTTCLLFAFWYTLPLFHDILQKLDILIDHQQVSIVILSFKRCLTTLKLCSFIIAWKGVLKIYWKISFHFFFFSLRCTTSQAIQHVPTTTAQPSSLSYACQ